MSVGSTVLDEVAEISRTYDRVFGRADLQLSDPTAEQLFRSLASPEQLSKSALIWVAPEMVDLLLHASLTLPLYPFRRSVLPWPDAVVVGAKPFRMSRPAIRGGEYPVKVLSWATLPATSTTHDFPAYQTWISSFSREGDGLLAPLNQIRVHEDSTFDGGYDNIGRTKSPNDPDRVLEHGRILCTLWLLLKQRVAVRRTSQASRGEQRRWARSQELPVPEITIIELRRPLPTNENRDDPGFVEWSRRWIVDGHWRNQYHPSTGEHVPTWIAPYVKGPEDKPLVVTRKVHAWTR